VTYIKIFTFLSEKEVIKKIEEHQEAPHLRVLQKTIAEEVTRLVHAEEELVKAQEASQILFGKATSEALQKLDQATFLELFEGVPQAEINRVQLEKGMDAVAALSAETGFLQSNGEARRALKENAISVNKKKIGVDYVIKNTDLIADQYVLLQRGKKNYYILKLRD
jgi:tyrosyl-tRNA synthetase